MLATPEILLFLSGSPNSSKAQLLSALPQLWAVLGRLQDSIDDEQAYQRDSTGHGRCDSIVPILCQKECTFSCSIRPLV